MPTGATTADEFEGGKSGAEARRILSLGDAGRRPDLQAEWRSTSKADLKTQLLAFIERYNPTAKPFAWTYQGKPLTK